MYSRTAPEKKEAKRNSRIFYETHCQTCKCLLSDNEIKQCDDCKSYEKLKILLKNIKERGHQIDPISNDPYVDISDVVMCDINGDYIFVSSKDFELKKNN